MGDNITFFNIKYFTRFNLVYINKYFLLEFYLTYHLKNII